MLVDQLGMQIYTTPPNKSKVNGQIERFHSTLSKIMRCLKRDQIHRSFEVLMGRAVYKYNYSIHSVTKKRPLEVFFGRRVTTDPTQYEQARLDNIEQLRRKQTEDLLDHNSRRKPIRAYEAGEEIFVKINTRLGSKQSNRFKKEIVEEDKNSTILTESGHIKT